MITAGNIDISDKTGKVSSIQNIPEDAIAMLILAHGAGADMNHFFMEELSSALADEKIATFRFNFPYREKGKKLPGSRKENILTVQKCIEHIETSLPLFVSGKSYGGRMASHALNEKKYPEVKGLIYFGFPLHAPGMPSSSRAGHLAYLTKPQLFLQGEKDKLAEISLLKEVIKGIPNAELETFPSADHSFKVAKKVQEDSNVPKLAKACADWISRFI